jgi:hypothetical protein
MKGGDNDVENQKRTRNRTRKNSAKKRGAENRKAPQLRLWLYTAVSSYKVDQMPGEQAGSPGCQPKYKTCTQAAIIADGVHTTCRPAFATH